MALVKAQMKALYFKWNYYLMKRGPDFCCSGPSLSLMCTPLPSASLRLTWCDRGGFRTDNNDVYLLSKELDEKVARLHISAHVEALKHITPRSRGVGTPGVIWQH